MYLAHRRLSEVYRSGEKSIAEAITKGTACWALDEETLIQMRALGIEFVGVLVRETGDKYLAPLTSFFDRTKTKILNYSARGGSLQRFLPLAEFTRVEGKIKRRR